MASTGKPFTDLFVASLKPNGKVTDCREGGSHGFGVRVLPNGTKKFFYVFNIDGKRRFLNLGVYKDNQHKSGVTLADARKKYVKARSDVLRGVDPSLEKERLKAERNRTPYVADFVTEYIEKYGKQKTRGWKETERVLCKEVVSRWGKRKITDVKKRDLVLLLDEIKERGAHIMANRTLAYVRGMFSYAVERDVLEVNPFLGMKMPSEEVSRERVLAPAEIGALWSNLDQASMSDSVRRALKMILITGQRPGEVIGMHSREIDDRWWTIPVARSKNKQAHRVYLSDAALRLIDGRDGYIFNSSIRDDKPVEVRTLTSSIKRNLPHTPRSQVVDKLKIRHFVPHDLRRTAATLLAELGVPGDIIDRVQNHITKQKAGVAHIYNRYSYDKEKQLALEALSAKLNEILTA